jgi:Pyridoxamine 5'-phosphate oxidase
MSVRVELRELATTLADFDVAYLVTVSGDGRAHVLSVWAEPSDAGLVVEGVGRHTQANAAANPDVTLVFPPLERGGYSLLVDGTATVDDTTVTIVPSSAILHRAAVAPDGRRVGSDCVDVDVQVGRAG